MLALAATGCEKSASHKAEAKKTVTYQAQGPDGQIYTLQGPEGLPRETVLAEIRRRAILANAQNIPVGCGDDCDPEPQDEGRNPYRGDVQLNYGTSRYGDPTYRYRGEIEDDGYVRMRNLNGDTLRGYVESDGSVCGSSQWRGLGGRADGRTPDCADDRAVHRDRSQLRQGAPRCSAGIAFLDQFEEPLERWVVVIRAPVKGIFQAGRSVGIVKLTELEVLPRHALRGLSSNRDEPLAR